MEGNAHPGLRALAAGLAVCSMLAVTACGGEDGGGGTDAETSAAGEFAIYDWEPNVVAAPGVSDPANTGLSRAKAEQLAADTPGTVVLLEPEPLDIPQTEFDETEGIERKYYVLRDRPALGADEVRSAEVQIDQTTEQPSIIVYLTGEGAEKYADLTFKGAKRGETLPDDPLAVSVGPRHAIVVGDEMLSIPQLGPGTYTSGVKTDVITVVGGFDEARAEELAAAIDPG